MSPAAPARSPTSNRSSYAWVPFTPTNTSFPREDQQQQQQRRALFVAHLPFSALVPFLKQHQLVSGILRVNKRNRSDAYVFCDDLNADIYICGSRDRNRALEGDVVAIKLVEVDRVIREKQEKEQAKIARNNGQPIVRKPDEEDEKEIMFGGEEDVDKVKPKYCGIVVAILERAQSQVFSGTLGLTRPSSRRPRKDGDMAADDDDHSVKSDSSPRIVWFKPTDKRVPLIAIPVEQAPQGFLENNQQFENRLFLGSIKRWPITSLHPFGVLENELGHVHDIVVQFRAILADNNFSFEPFADPVMGCLPSTPWVCSDAVIRSRLDLRAIRTITISHNGVLDNALSIKQKSDNIYEVGFHVADLAAFVMPHSTIDREAKARAAAVYLYESAPLWPEKLLNECTNLVACSTRLAFSVIWKIDQSGKVIDTWYGKTVIKSHGVLTTNEVQDILDGNGVPSHINLQDHEKPLWEDDINVLYSLSQNLKQARRRNGAMFLVKQTLDISVDGNGHPTTIKLAARLPADDIVDEFSILANTGVAHKISSYFPEHALLQSQAPPNERKLRELSQYLRGLGYTINPSTAQSLQQTVDAIENDAAKKVVTTLVLKTMSPSKFFCIGKFDINRYHHYSLNAPLYTQFTCPSRSYADVIVHRQLEAVLAGDKRFYLENEVIQKIARHCNVKGQSADNAREQAQHLFMSQYLARMRGSSTATAHEAIVVGVQDQAFDVIVPGLGLERRIHVINLPLETFKYNPADGVLHLFWKPGVATADTMAEQADAMAELEDDEEDEDDEDLAQLSPTTSAPPSTNTDHLISDAVHELSVKSVSSPPSAGQSFTKKRPRSMSLRVVEGENPWTSQQDCTIPDESRQVIRPFDYIRVVITSDPDRSPPLIRVLAANPFV
ncbi:hypothetical protein BX666DRAFT_1851043 [Dichotomocladium elegans]|nr:hypothetical protein BX666DRAFT_1851043 [Dichotomocladium elegans]